MDRPAHERRWLVFVSVLLLCGQAGPVAIQQQATLTEWSIPVAPMHLTTVSARRVYFTAEGRLGELDIVKDVLRLWSTPDGNLAGHSVARFGDSVIFGARGGRRTIGLLNPRSGVLREWTLPAPGTASHFVRLGRHVYFTSPGLGGGRNTIGRLDIRSGVLTEWRIPTPGAGPNGIDVLGTRIVFAEFGANKIGLLDPAMNQMLEWPVPPGSGADHVRAADGVVYFTQEAASDNVGRLDPLTNVMTEWQVPTVAASADGIDVLRPGLFVFTEFGGNRIGQLDTTAEIGANTVVVPDVTMVAPVATLLVPTDTVLVPEEIPVERVSTLVNGTATGGFLEWLLPTPNSAPLGIQRVRDRVKAFEEEEEEAEEQAGDRRGGRVVVVFCEFGSRRIGLLR